MKNEFNQEELPQKALESIGLWKDGKALLCKEDLDALLSGRRTSFIRLENLQADGFQIPQLDVKLSLSLDAEGRLDLVFHPIYKEAKPHPLLTDSEAKDLIEGQKVSLLKTYRPEGKEALQVVLQYDKDTREFITYNPSRVQVPEEINGQKLTEKQKESYKRGELITLEDQTNLRIAASDSKGVLSDKAALILSFLTDGGITYLVIKGLKDLDGRLPATGFSEGYKKALEDMNRRDPSDDKEIRKDFPEIGRGYSRTGSR